MRFFLKSVINLIGLILFLLCALRVFSDYKTAEAERLYPAQGKFIQADGLKMHYVRKGSGRPVVLIHGSFGSVNDFTFSIFDRAVSLYDVTAIDRAGHGYSERSGKPMDLFDHARVLREVLRSLGIQKPVIAGHSLGAGVALAYAQAYPEDAAALVLLAGYVTPYEGPPRWIHRAPAWPVIGKVYENTLVQPLGHYFQDQIARRVFSAGVVLPEGYLEAAGALARRPRHFSANAEDIRLLPSGLDKLREGFAKMTLPVIYLAADNDAIAPMQRHAESLARLLPSAEILLAPGAGHQPSFTAPGKVLEALDLAWRRADERLTPSPKEPSANPPELLELPLR